MTKNSTLRELTTRRDPESGFYRGTAENAAAACEGPRLGQIANQIVRTRQFGEEQSKWLRPRGEVQTIGRTRQLPSRPESRCDWISDCTFWVVISDLDVREISARR